MGGEGSIGLGERRAAGNVEKKIGNMKKDNVVGLAYVGSHVQQNLSLDLRWRTF